MSITGKDTLQNAHEHNLSLSTLEGHISSGFFTYSIDLE